MIVGRIENFSSKNFVSKNLKTAFDYLKKTDLLSISSGKTIIDGDNVWINRSSYIGKDEKDCKWENHQKYLDIQLVIKGKEKIGYVDLSNDSVSIIGEYDSLKDRANFTAKEEAMITLNSGAFVIVWPHDLHKPCIKVNDEIIEKIVVKVKIDN